MPANRKRVRLRIALRVCGPFGGSNGPTGSHRDVKTAAVARRSCSRFRGGGSGVLRIHHVRARAGVDAGAVRAEQDDVHARGLVRKVPPHDPELYGPAPLHGTKRSGSVPTLTVAERGATAGRSPLLGMRGSRQRYTLQVPSQKSIHTLTRARGRIRGRRPSTRAVRLPAEAMVRAGQADSCFGPESPDAR